MAIILFLYDDLPTLAAKAIARAVWRRIYSGLPFLLPDGTYIIAEPPRTEREVEAAIRADVQRIGFRFREDGELGI